MPSKCLRDGSQLAGVSFIQSLLLQVSVLFQGIPLAAGAPLTLSANTPLLLFFLALLHVIHGLSSPTRDLVHAPFSGSYDS